MLNFDREGIKGLKCCEVVAGKVSEAKNKLQDTKVQEQEK
jgi:hypothetical protein